MLQFCEIYRHIATHWNALQSSTAQHRFCDTRIRQKRVAQPYLENATTVEGSTVVLEVGVGKGTPQPVAVDTAPLAAEGLQGAVLREDAAMHVGCSVVLV